MGKFYSFKGILLIIFLLIIALACFSIFSSAYTEDELIQSSVSSTYGKTYDSTPLYDDFALNRSVSSTGSQGPSYSNKYITRTYTWTYNRDVNTITLQIPEGHYNYYKNQSHTRNYSSYALSDYDRQLLSSMIEGFKQQAEKNGYSDYDSVMNVISFVQSMPYTSDSVTTGYDEYPRFPIETLVDGGGDCEDSAILAAALLSEMNYGTVLIVLPGHMALGVKGSDTLPGSYFTYNGSRYYYVETTASGWGVGDLPPQYEGASARLYPMLPIATVNVALYEVFHASDLEFVYYRVFCFVENRGPSTAKDVDVYFVGVTSGFDTTYNVSIGSIADGGIGTAEATFKVPRGNYAAFGCVVHGSNFLTVNKTIDPILADPQTDLSANLTWTYLDSDFKYKYYRVRCNIENTGNSLADNVSVRIAAQPSYDETVLWTPGHTIQMNIIPQGKTEYAEAIVRVPKNKSVIFTGKVYGDNFNSSVVRSNIVYT